MTAGGRASVAGWPGWRVHSALSLPMMVGDQVIGAINTYARSRDAFGEHAVQLGSQFAGPAAVSVYNATAARPRSGADQTVADMRWAAAP